MHTCYPNDFTANVCKSKAAPEYGSAAAGAESVENLTSKTARQSLQARFASGLPLLLDGATGSELEARGVDMGLPLWGASAAVTAPACLAGIHRDYLAVGCELVCANTFRTTPWVLGDRAQASAWTAASVALARQSGARFVAGSLAPLEDCYHPERRPPEPALRKEHAEQAQSLAAAGCDVILVETHNSSLEACIALEAAQATGLPVVAGFCLDAAGRMLSGEPLAAAWGELLHRNPTGLLVNCTPVAAIDRILPALIAQAGDTPVWVYPNWSYQEGGSWQPRLGEEAAFARASLRWAEMGARGLGGCCGTGPAEIDALRRALRGVTLGD